MIDICRSSYPSQIEKNKWQRANLALPQQSPFETAIESFSAVKVLSIQIVLDSSWLAGFSLLIGSGGFMRSILFFTIFWLSLPTAASEPQARVEYHLKRMETVLEKTDSEVKLKPLGADTYESNQDQRFDPHFGVGDEANLPSLEPSPQFQDIPQVLSPRDLVRREALSRRQVSGKVQTSDPDLMDQFVEEFKKNAARNGVRVYVDPKTLEVREGR